MREFLAADKRAQAAQPLNQGIRIALEMAVVLPPKLHSLAHRRADGKESSVAHRFEQRARQLSRPDLLAFRFNPDGFLRIESPERVDQLRLEPFLRRLLQ